MNSKITRRTALKLVSAGTVAGITSQSNLATAAPPTTSKPNAAWEKGHDRVWLGGEFWANPMEDWKIIDGAAECQTTRPGRNIHSITRQITEPGAGFTMSVRLSQVEMKGQDAGAGFRIGIRSELNEHRSNCFAKNGINAGIQNGKLILGPQSLPFSADTSSKEIDLQLTGKADGEKVALTLEAISPKTKATLGTLIHNVVANSLLGNVALANSYATNKKSPKAASRYRFSQWTLEGEAFTVSPNQKFGPILWSMYSLSDSRTEEGFVMKISALTGPMGAKDSQVVELRIQRDGKWKSLGEAKLDPDAWVATFRIPNWDEKAATPYKLVYREKHNDGTETPDEWTGTIQANPVGRPLRMAALTCQNDYAFPYAPVSTNVEKLKPDLVFFSGDQIYESHGGFGIIREPAEMATLNYLRKYYQFGWAFRNVMHSQPTLCLPDDHDVLQGNIWGEAGKKMVASKTDAGASGRGGYIEPARMVNAVHRTTVAHQPDPFDPTPVQQGISVYYGDMVYGDVGFAIIADRQWKSGPEEVKAEFARIGRKADQETRNRIFDKPGLVLLGERQEEFLEKWAHDWRGHRLKAVLSQTVFAGLATHQSEYDKRIRYDFDCGGWPRTPRNRAIEIIRPSMALHINGDQHLSTLSQYGVEKQRDSNWAFCTPAIAVGFPRWWRPDETEDMQKQNRPKHGLPNTGEYLDGHNNKTYVYAVGNPAVGKAPNRYDKAHEKGSGFGFVTFDTEKLTYHIESFRFLVDVADASQSNQFPGWPVTIHQAENRGENLIE